MHTPGIAGSGGNDIAVLLAFRLALRVYLSILANMVEALAAINKEVLAGDVLVVENVQQRLTQLFYRPLALEGNTLHPPANVVIATGRPRQDHSRSDAIDADTRSKFHGGHFSQFGQGFFCRQ